MRNGKDRAVGVNISIPSSRVVDIDSKAKRLNMKRSEYIRSLIDKDLDKDSS